MPRCWTRSRSGRSRSCPTASILLRTSKMRWAAWTSMVLCSVYWPTERSSLRILWSSRCSRLSTATKTRPAWKCLRRCVHSAWRGVSSSPAALARGTHQGVHGVRYGSSARQARRLCFGPVAGAMLWPGGARQCWPMGAFGAPAAVWMEGGDIGAQSARLDARCVRPRP